MGLEPLEPGMQLTYQPLENWEGRERQLLKPVKSRQKRCGERNIGRISVDMLIFIQLYIQHNITYRL